MADPSVLTLELETELLPGAELAPALRQAVLVEDQRGVRAAVLTSSSFRVGCFAEPVLDVVTDAPAASVDAVVALDQLREGLPRGSVEWTGREGGLPAGVGPAGLLFLPVHGPISFSREA